MREETHKPLTGAGEEAWGKPEEETGSPCLGVGSLLSLTMLGQAGVALGGPRLSVTCGDLAGSQTSTEGLWQHSQGALGTSQIRTEMFGPSYLPSELTT